jgi:Predicted transcriptional regulators
MEQFGKKVLECRRERKQSQEDFARIFNVTRQTISNWENSKSFPDLFTLVELSKELDMSLDYLLKEDIYMVEKINKDLKDGRRFKKIWNYLKGGIVLCVIFMLIYTSIWNAKKGELENYFQEGVVKNNFNFQESSGTFRKHDSNISYMLPNQRMPSIFDFSLNFYNKILEINVSSTDKIEITITSEDGGWISFNGKSKSYEINKEGELINKKFSKIDKEIYENLKDEIHEHLETGFLIYQDVYL